MRSYVYDIIRFFIVILIQVLVMDNIQFSGYVNPFFYIIFILLLPFEIPGWLLLITAFILGFSIDLFSGLSGMHAAATVFMAFLRPFVLKRFAPYEGYVSGTFPRIHYYGVVWFSKYTFTLVSAHSILIFILESFGFSDFFPIIVRIVLSTLFTGILIIISQFFMFRK